MVFLILHEHIVPRQRDTRTGAGYITMKSMEPVTSLNFELHEYREPAYGNREYRDSAPPQDQNDILENFHESKIHYD